MYAAGARRKYENVRRQWKDDGKEESVSKAEEDAKKNGLGSAFTGYEC